MLERLKSRNWGRAFEFATPAVCKAGHQHTNPEAIIAAGGVATTPFTREDVVEIIGIADGERGDDEWIGVFRLKDGRYASLRAGCDYSGWN